MLWHGPTLNDLLTEIASAYKLDAIGGVPSLRDAARDALRPLSRLRTANATHGWGMNFDTLNLGPKIDRNTLALNVHAVCSALWNPALPATLRELTTIASDESATPVCPDTGQVLIRGRDALCVTGRALRSLIGNFSHQQARVDRLEEQLRLAAQPRHMTHFQWFHTLQRTLKLR